MSVFTLHFIYVFVLGIVTDLTNTQDPLFVREHSTLDQLVTGLMEPCHCGPVKWVTSSCKQVKKKENKSSCHFYLNIETDIWDII